MPVAVVLLLIACTGAPADFPSPQSPAGYPLRILATDLSSATEEPFSVGAATNQDDYDELWQRIGGTPPPLAVNFERQVVLFLGMAGSSSCPERFAGLAIDATSRVYAEWAPQPPNRPCTDDLAPQGTLLAVARSALPAEPFLLSLRDQPICPDCADHPDQLVVDPR
ncbi:MAG: hypothetical protein M3253_07645 [Chloroflexota bacterium]|nr:hypothetical protein [Chloroflexota bacterium]